MSMFLDTLWGVFLCFCFLIIIIIFLFFSPPDSHRYPQDESADSIIPAAAGTGGESCHIFLFFFLNLSLQSSLLYCKQYTESSYSLS